MVLLLAGGAVALSGCSDKDFAYGSMAAALVVGSVRGGRESPTPYVPTHRGREQCEQELLHFPPLEVAGGFLDEGAGFHDAEYMFFLTRPGVHFIDVPIRREIRLVESSSFRIPIRQNWWNKSFPNANFLRLELAEGSSANCVPRTYYGTRVESEFAYSSKNYLVKKDTCLAARPITSSDARYALTYERGGHQLGRDFGYWVVNDRTTGQRVVAVTTPDGVGSESKDQFSNRGNVSIYYDLVEQLQSHPKTANDLLPRFCAAPYSLVAIHLVRSIKEEAVSNQLVRRQ
jgi:hypothetical protein